MKKLFTFFAAALVALAVNAAIDGGTGTLADAIEAASSGDVIELNAGTYVEDTIDIYKNLTIKAADMNNLPVVQAKGLGISGTTVGVRVKFEGIKFDAQNSGEHLLYSYDKTNSGNELILEGCELYTFNQNSSLINCGSAYKLDSLVINNCQFHDIMKSCIFLENSDLIGLKITNSTFVNISTNTEKYWAGIIDPRTTSGGVLVDHCTFYNCTPMNTDYGAVKVLNTTGAVVSNSIFMMPSSTALRAIHMKPGNQVKNCIVYNYTASTNGIHYNVTPSDCQFVDPQFADPANNNFTPNEVTSPAKGTGVGGTHLGDPYWWPASWAPAEVIPVASVALDKNALTLDVNETAFLHATVLPVDATDPTVSWSSSDKTVATVVNGAVKGIAVGIATITAKAGEKTATCEVTVSDVIPSTDFAEPYFLKGTKATLEGNIDVNESDSLHYQGHSAAGTATWKINATRGCVIGATANFKTSSASGAKLRIVILDEDENQVGDSLMQEYYEHGGDKAFTGSIALTEAGVYTIKLVNVQKWSSSKLNGITLTYVSDLPSAAAKGGWDGWANVLEFTLAKDAKTASVKKTFNKGDEFEFKMLINGTENENFRANGWWFKRDVTTATGITGNGDNMKIIADYTGEYTFTWTFATNTLVVTYPEPVLPNGFYLVGTFGGEDEWEYASLSAAKKFAETEVEGEYTLEYTLAKGDRFKAIYLENDTYKTWYPEGSGNDYVVTEWTAGEKTIYFRPESKSEWGGHFYIAPNEPVATSISNTEASSKAQKLIENGQIVIIKNGVKYNVLGACLK